MNLQWGVKVFASRRSRLFVLSFFSKLVVVFSRKRGIFFFAQVIVVLSLLSLFFEKEELLRVFGYRLFLDNSFSLFLIHINRESFSKVSNRRANDVFFFIRDVIAPYSQARDDDDVVVVVFEKIIRSTSSSKSSSEIFITVIIIIIIINQTKENNNCFE